MLSIVLEINDEEDDEMDNYSIHKCFKYINDTVGVIKNAYDEGNVGVLEILTSTHHVSLLGHCKDREAGLGNSYQLENVSGISGNKRVMFYFMYSLNL